MEGENNNSDNGSNMSQTGFAYGNATVTHGTSSNSRSGTSGRSGGSGVSTAFGGNSSGGSGDDDCNWFFCDD
jgi:hypothetical protein